MVGRGRPRDAGVEGRVLEAAMTEMRARGYDGMSVDRVAERAGVAKTTIYRRWPSKAELVVAMIAGLRSAVPFEPSGDARRDLTELVTGIAATLEVIPTTLVADLTAAAAREPRVGDSVRALWAERHAAVTAVIAQAQSEGLLLAHADPGVVVDQLVGPLYYRLLITGEPIDPAYVRALVHSTLGPENKS
ncbi:TetR/AcrR family transcriptional regulator [Kribbella sp. NPDC058693]|uniref:TetR/AcrR family transcriptional regulator n=2 Tax=Kribbella TaxID=182639 RepID=A0A4U3M5L3_9ACTN|nr:MULTISPECIES: TetR/AcrR family transcriptional regulator [Kribbella]RZU16126.1 TetR family transcriptional regulator [Kribbella rubisoli]TKK82657.1 TetR/AcrR family transcriptional regulator [Kribbella jiaozuonensis]